MYVCAYMHVYVHLYVLMGASRCSEGPLFRRFVGPNSRPIRVLHA